MSNVRPFVPRFEIRKGDRRRMWEDFARDEELKRLHNIQPHEMESLKQRAMLGNLRSKEDFIFMLSVIRGQLRS
jgi:siroheme synthase (precorrin-2 oxidase/ferrochelatase)